MTYLLNERASIPDNAPLAPWSWNNSDKLLTVVSWDAGYREEKWLDLSFKCLEKQTYLDQVECIHINWGPTPNKVLQKYPFIKNYCLNFTEDNRQWPAYDVGIQWSIGLFLAKTPYVLYFHNDIIVRNQLEILINKIKENPEMIVYAGYGCYGKPNRKRRIEERITPEMFLSMVDEAGDDFDLLPNTYTPQAKPGVDCHLATFNKEKLITKFDGFQWNFYGERWDSLGKQLRKMDPKKHQEIPRGIMYNCQMNKTGLLAQPDMKVFPIPHGGQGLYRPNRPIDVQYKYIGGPKYYSDFLRDWLPTHIEDLRVYKWD